MEKDLEDIFEKIGNDLLQKEIRTKKESYKDEFVNINNNIKDINEKLMGFQKEGENIYEVISEEDNKEEDFILKAILEDLNKNIIINVKEQEEVQKQKAIDEILQILKFPHSDKNTKINSSPFKSLFQPKKISMVGRVFYNSTNNNENINSNKDNTNSSNNNGGTIEK